MKDRREIWGEEKVKRGIKGEVRKVQTSWQLKTLSNQNKKEEKSLKEVMVKIGLERIDTYKGITVKALLDSSVTELVMSSEFTRKQEFELKKINRPIYVRNMDRSFNKEGSIEHMVEVNIYY